jgi:hypothetical protein
LESGEIVFRRVQSRDEADLARTLAVGVALAHVSSALVGLDAVLVAVARPAARVPVVAPVALVAVCAAEPGDAVTVPV